MTIRNEVIENTIGFFWTDNTEENGELFTEYYGPIQQLFTELGLISMLHCNIIGIKTNLYV